DGAVKRRSKVEGRRKASRPDFRHLTFGLQPGGESAVAAFLIVVAAGAGNRLGRPEPKALVELLGRPLLYWTLKAVSPVCFAWIVIAAPAGRLDDVRAVAGAGAKVVEGGATRGASVRRAFQACV